MEDTTSKDQPKCSQEQYDRLLRCSEKIDVSEWNDWRKENPEEEVLLEGAPLGSTHLEGANFVNAHLQDAIFGHAHLQGANLSEAHLQDAHLFYARLQGTDLRSAHLEGAHLWNAHLEGANLWNAHLEGADLSYAHLERADLTEANLEGVNLTLAHLEGARLYAANLEKADVYGAVLNRWTKCRGIRVATCYGSPRFKRQAADQDYLDELQSTFRGTLIYYIWLVLADCGRSFLRPLLWSLGIAALFARVFHKLGPGAFHVEWLPHETFWESYNTMLYYSVVTFTTLGFGDVVPKTPEAAHWVMFEVILGYIMLGMLISVLANKVARRSGM